MTGHSLILSQLLLGLYFLYFRENAEAGGKSTGPDQRLVPFEGLFSDTTSRILQESPYFICY